jgi:hypothetical protein
VAVERSENGDKDTEMTVKDSHFRYGAIGSRVAAIFAFLLHAGELGCRYLFAVFRQNTSRDRVGHDIRNHAACRQTQING